MSKRLKYSCKFPNCKNSYYVTDDPNYKNKHFYRFPSKSRIHLLNKWKEVCNIKRNVPTNNVYVCEDHFLPKEFINDSRRRVNYSVIPKDLTRLSSDLTNVSLDHPYLKSPLKSNVTGDTKNTAEDDTEYYIEIDTNAEPMDEGSGEVEVTYDLDDEVFCDLYVQFKRSDAAETTDKSENDFNLLIYDRCEFLLYPFQPINIVHENDENINEEGASMSQHELRHKYIIDKLSRLQEIVGDETDYLNIFFKLWKNGMFKVIRDDIKNLSSAFVSSKVLFAENSSIPKDWSAQEKTIALFLCKYSRRFYRYLCSYFHLPPATVLNTLISNISLDTGLNRSILSTLESLEARLDHLDKRCYLVFDKMPLEQRFSYDSNKQIIYGYQDVGHLGRSNMVAKYALVFMICGLRKPWKHFVAYYFVEHAMESDCFKKLIVQVISQVQEIGFNVVSTVCECNSVNFTVLEELCKESNSFYFLVNNKPVLTMFNVPNLLERTRNTFFRYNVKIQDASVAKFEDIATVFNMEKERKLKMLPDVEVESVINKEVNVEMAAVQLSRAVASGIITLVEKNHMPKEALNTAEFVSTIDRLFGFLSRSKLDCKDEGELIEKLPHADLWMEILDRLDTWNIIETDCQKTASNFITGWQVTLRSVMTLWEDVKNLGYDYLDLKMLSEKPLKDLFFHIKKYDRRNKYLTCFKFTDALKNCIIESCSSSPENVLSDSDVLCSLVYRWVEIATSRNNDDSERSIKDLSSCNIDAKFIVDVILNRINFEETCKRCKSVLFSSEVTGSDPNDNFYQISQWLIQYLAVISEKLYKCLERHCHMDFLEDRFKYAFTQKSAITFCDTHTLEVSILNEVVPLLIHKHVQENNKTLQMIYQKQKQM